MDILKRDLAPITSEAWAEIDKQAQQVFQTVLTARRLLEVKGPHGWQLGAVNTGRIKELKTDEKTSAEYGSYLVQPLVENRIYFELDIWELDNINRGARDANLDDMVAAARKSAAFEEQAVYYGLAAGGMHGLSQSSAYQPIEIREDGRSIVAAVAHAMAMFMEASVGGPYALAVSPGLWQALTRSMDEYPAFEHLRTVLAGPILMSPFITDAFLLSQRGGDTELTIGQDLSIGFHSHSTRTVQLYFTESFTFRVLEKRAVAFFSLKK